MADDNVFLVPADDAPFTAPGSVRALTPDELAALPLAQTAVTDASMTTTTLAAPTLPEILYTASVLVQRRSCPVDVVNSILAFAGLYLSFESETHARVYGHDNMDDEYVRLDLPSARELALPVGVTVARCVCVAVACESKDQGWASEHPELNGTYEASCTWLEVSVEKPTVTAAAAGSGGAASTANETAATSDTFTAGAIEIRALGALSHHEPGRIVHSTTDDGATTVVAGSDAETPATETATPAKVEVARVRAFCNVRASRRFRRHVKWYCDPSGLVRDVALGDSVCLVLRSQYPGWTNSARFGRVRALFELELDEAFSSADIVFPVDAAAGSRGGDAASRRSTCCLQ